MDYLSRCRWFGEVSWPQNNSFVDCLVDITRQDGDGYFVVVEHNELKLYSSPQLQNIIPAGSVEVLGKAIKWILSY